MSNYVYVNDDERAALVDAARSSKPLADLLARLEENRSQADDPRIQAYIAGAKDELHKSDHSIDADPLVSESDYGAYVMAWVWVYGPDDEDEGCGDGSTSTMTEQESLTE